MTPDWVVPFLRALAAGCTVVDACAHAGISSATAYTLRKGDADFAESWRLALEDSTDVLERVARSRAIHGTQEPVVYQGQLTPVYERDEDGEIVMDEREVLGVDKDGEPVRKMQLVPRQARTPEGALQWLTVTKHDNSLLWNLLRARRYNVERTELTGKDGQPLAIDDVARRARIAAIVAAAQERTKLA